MAKSFIMKKSIIYFIFCVLWQMAAIAQSADLSLDISVDDNAVDAGQELTFTVRVINNGPDTSLNVKVLSLLPSGYDFVGYDSNKGSYDAISGVWDIGGMGFGINAILKITASAKHSGEHEMFAEVIASDLLDYDSVPNNGVDTDRDGNKMDDPDDEDDGDGQIVIVGSADSSSKDPSLASGECLAPLDVESAFTANPVDEIDVVFKFDYKINAIMNFQMSDTEEFSPEYSRGNPTQMIMEYYVNSADGSMLFPGGPTGFFKTNLSYSDLKGTIDAAIWLANGQMVSYVYDANNDKKHAITREIKQTANSRFGTDYMNMMQFFRSSFELAEQPDPLPSHVQWPGSTKGYRGELIESYTGLTNTWDIYFDTTPTPIRTSCIMMGFMVGVLKDVRNTQCNRLAVYTKVNIGGTGTGDAIEVELKSIKPMGITFDGSVYKPMTIGGEYGTTAGAKMDDYTAKMRRVESRIKIAKIERGNCIADWCIEEKDALLESLQKEKSRVICEQMVNMGMEDSFAECMRKEEEGY